MPGPGISAIVFSLKRGDLPIEKPLFGFIVLSPFAFSYGSPRLAKEILISGLTSVFIRSDLFYGNITFPYDFFFSFESTLLSFKIKELIW